MMYWNLLEKKIWYKLEMHLNWYILPETSRVGSPSHHWPTIRYIACGPSMTEQWTPAWQLLGQLVLYKASILPETHQGRFPSGFRRVSAVPSFTDHTVFITREMEMQYLMDNIDWTPYPTLYFVFLWKRLDFDWICALCMTLQSSLHFVTIDGVAVALHILTSNFTF